MRSVADEVRREELERYARMTPAERVALSERLGREGLEQFMAARGLDRSAALRALRASRRAGRRRSASADEER